MLNLVANKVLPYTIPNLSCHLARYTLYCANHMLNALPLIAGQTNDPPLIERILERIKKLVKQIRKVREGLGTI